MVSGCAPALQQSKWCNSNVSKCLDPHAVCEQQPEVVAACLLSRDKVKHSNSGDDDELPELPKKVRGAENDTTKAKVSV